MLRWAECRGIVVGTCPPSSKRRRHERLRPRHLYFDDRLEHLALRQTACRVRKCRDAQEAIAEGIISDIVTADRDEFPILDPAGERIRTNTTRDNRLLG